MLLRSFHGGPLPLRGVWGEHRSGFSLNGDVFKLRGFSHHNSIGGLGVAIPERINLFRVQAARALGSNIWRMSHNPYSPHLYDLLDIVGLTCWDENRDYGAKYNGGAYARQMHDMVKRDRNHPSTGKMGAGTTSVGNKLASS